MVHMPAVDPEEDQVTRGQGVHGNGARRTPLRVSCARNLDTSLLVRIHRKATAIESVQIGAAEMIWDTNNLRRRLGDENSAVSRQFI